MYFAAELKKACQNLKEARWAADFRNKSEETILSTLCNCAVLQVAPKLVRLTRPRPFQTKHPDCGVGIVALKSIIFVHGKESELSFVINAVVDVMG